MWEFIIRIGLKQSGRLRSLTLGWLHPRDEGGQRWGCCLNPKAWELGGNGVCPTRGQEETYVPARAARQYTRALPHVALSCPSVGWLRAICFIQSTTQVRSSSRNTLKTHQETMFNQISGRVRTRPSGHKKSATIAACHWKSCPMRLKWKSWVWV